MFSRAGMYLVLAAKRGNIRAAQVMVRLKMSHGEQLRLVNVWRGWSPEREPRCKGGLGSFINASVM